VFTSLCIEKELVAKEEEQEEEGGGVATKQI
jgi:hypothetical protein